MKLRKEYIIAAVLIAASVLYLVFRNDSRVNYEIPRFSALEKDNITSVSVSGSDGSIELKKENGDWVISPGGYRVSASEMNRLLSEIDTLSIVDLISPREDYSRYELDDVKGITIKVSTADGTVRDFVAGKTSSSSIYTYIRLADRKGVYSVRGNLKSVFSTSQDKWRDKQILNFNADEAAAIGIDKGGEKIMFNRTLGTETPGWSRDGVPLDNSAEIDSDLKTLGMLKTTGFLDEELSGEPQAVLHITTSSVTQTLEIYDKRDKGYAAKSSYGEQPFLIPVYVGDMILGL